MAILRRSLYLSLLSVCPLIADAPISLDSFMEDSIVERETPALVQEVEPLFTPPPVKAVPKEQAIPFSPFTGKIKGRNVRVRLQADLDSRIVKELGKNELVNVIGQKDNFWIVQAPANLKAYVFRSFVLDDVVEGTHVNVRLQPSLDAPVIGHLNAGDKVKGVISALNQKWLEIDPPAETKFYISKDLIEYAGGPDFKALFDQRTLAAEELLDSTAVLAKAELRKSFEEIDFDRVIKGYNTLIADYNDFPEQVEHAKNALASFQENYLQKRISHIEMAAKETVVAKEEPKHVAPVEPSTDKMKMWEPVEQALYASWASSHEKLSQDQFYEEQMLACETITGILEPYHSPVKGKPGDFIIRNQDVPVAYVYSTKVNLQKLVGEQVSLKVTTRPNNNFAFPAYYVLSKE